MASGKVRGRKTHKMKGKKCQQEKKSNKFLYTVLCCLSAFGLVALSPWACSTKAQSVGNPVNSSWQSISAFQANCYKWDITGYACEAKAARISSMTMRATGYIADTLYLISFNYTVKVANTEAFVGLSSGENFVVVNQTLTQSGDQFHGSVLAITRVSKGVATMQTDTKYNMTNSWSILFSRPISVPLFDESGAPDLGGITEYLRNISWNSTETQKKLENIIKYLQTTNSHLSIIEWNSTETQKKLEQIIEAMGNINVDTNKVEDAIKDQTQAEQDRWEQENNKAEGAINSEQDTGAEGSDEAAKNGLNIFKLILETPAGNCKLPEIEAFGFSLGELDLCAYKPPTWIEQVMGAVVTITLAGASIKCTTRVLEELGRAYGGTR